MNNDLISRSYLQNLPFERVIHTDFGETAIPIEEIDNAPTVEMPQGEWLAEGKEYIQCSHCKEWFKKRYLPYGNFCCKCGAKMTEGIRYENIACNSGS